MLNYYHVLCIAPTASRSDIEAALAKQHALGKLPPATLKLAADTYSHLRAARCMTPNSPACPR